MQKLLQLGFQNLHSVHFTASIADHEDKMARGINLSFRLLTLTEEYLLTIAQVDDPTLEL